MAPPAPTKVGWHTTFTSCPLLMFSRRVGLSIEYDCVLDSSMTMAVEVEEVPTIRSSQ